MSRIKSASGQAGVADSRHGSRLRVRQYLADLLEPLSPGEPLPPMRTLATESGASLARLDSILKDLAAEGLVDRRPRRGIYKNAPPDVPAVSPFVNGSAGPSVPADAQTVNIGMVMEGWPGGMYNAYTIELLGYLKQHVRRAGTACRLVYEFVDLTEEPGRTPELLAADGIDAVIVMPFSRAGLAFMNRITPGRPLVSYGRELDNDDVPQVYVDYARGATTATEYLIQLGHRRIAALSIPSFPGNPSWHRLGGYRNALRGAGLTVDPACIVEVEVNHELIVRQTQALLCSPEPPTALFVADGTLLPAVLHAVTLAGKRMPQDVSIVSYDDTPVSRTHVPPITVIRQPLQHAMEVLLQETLSLVGNGPAAPQRRVIQTELVVRSSCNPVHTETDTTTQEKS